MAVRIGGGLTRSGGDNENVVGGVDACDSPEVHRQFDVANSRVLEPAAGTEVHCIDPGRYRIELYNLQYNQLVSSREIDYLGVSRVDLELVEVRLVQLQNGTRISEAKLQYAGSGISHCRVWSLW